MNRNCLFVCKRRPLVTLLIVICIAGLTVTAGKSSKAKENADALSGTENLGELQKLEEKLTAENEASERSGLQEAVKEQADGNRSSDPLKEAYRVKLLKNFWLTEYLKGGDLADHVSGKVQWKVPYQQDSGGKGIMTFALQGDRYVRLGESSGEKQEQMPVPKKKVAQIIVKAGITSEDIVKAEYYYSQMYSLVLIDIKTKDGEFVIPYAEFPEKMKSTDQREQITNGEVYKISDFMKEMNQIFDEEYLQDHPQEVVGMNYRRDMMAKKKWIIAGIFGIVVLFFVANTLTMKGFCYTDEVEDTYSAFLGTFISVDKGRWIGVHCINRYFLIQCSGYDKLDKKKFDSYQYIFGKPYFVFKNNGKKDDYPQEFLEKSKESNLGLPVQK